MELKVVSQFIKLLNKFTASPPCEKVDLGSDKGGLGAVFLFFVFGKRQLNLPNACTSVFASVVY